MGELDFLDGGPPHGMVQGEEDRSGQQSLPYMRIIARLLNDCNNDLQPAGAAMGIDKFVHYSRDLESYLETKCGL